jgi:hypothetical protein
MTLLVIQCLDLLTTYLGVFVQDGVELNPLVVYGWQQWGMEQWYVVKLVSPLLVIPFLLLRNFARREFGPGPWDYSIYFVLLVIAAHAVVVVLNTLQLIGG